jgi:hypothetical protein
MTLEAFTPRSSSAVPGAARSLDDRQGILNKTHGRAVKARRLLHMSLMAHLGAPL